MLIQKSSAQQDAKHEFVNTILASDALASVEGATAPSLQECKILLTSYKVDIFESGLRNLRFEMDALVTRVAMSPAIREQQDEFPMIAEPGGLMVSGQMGTFITEFKQNWKGSIDPGDVFITNDPYSVGGAVSHLNDWLVMVPVYSATKLSKRPKSVL